MTGETGMSLAVAGRKRQAVQTVRRLAECSTKWRLRQETSDGRLLTDGTAGCAAAAWTTTADGDDLAGLIPERVGTFVWNAVWVRYAGSPVKAVCDAVSKDKVDDAGAVKCSVAIGGHRWRHVTGSGPRDVIDVSVWSAVVVVMVSPAIAPHNHVRVGELAPSTDGAASLQHVTSISYLN